MHARRTQIERRLGFLNAVLAANAVLLAGLLWSHLAGSPGSNVALAAPQQSETFPNASAQRLQIVTELKGLRNDVARLEGFLSSGRMKVHVANPNEVRSEFDYARFRQLLRETAPKESAAPAVQETQAPAKDATATATAPVAQGAESKEAAPK